MSENINSAWSETEYPPVEDPQHMNIIASNEKNVLSEIPNAINAENVIIVLGQDKQDEFVEEQAHFLAFILRVRLTIICHNIFQ